MEQIKDLAEIASKNLCGAVDDGQDSIVLVFLDGTFIQITATNGDGGVGITTEYDLMPEHWLDPQPLIDIGVTTTEEIARRNAEYNAKLRAEQRTHTEKNLKYHEAGLEAARKRLAAFDAGEKNP